MKSKIIRYCYFLLFLEKVCKLLQNRWKSDEHNVTLSVDESSEILNKAKDKFVSYLVKNKQFHKNKNKLEKKCSLLYYDRTIPICICCGTVQFTHNSASPSKNAVSAFQISCKLLSFILKDSWRNQQAINALP